MEKCYGNGKTYIHNYQCQKRYMIKMRCEIQMTKKMVEGYTDFISRYSSKNKQYKN